MKRLPDIEQMYKKSTLATRQVLLAIESREPVIPDTLTGAQRRQYAQELGKLWQWRCYDLNESQLTDPLLHRELNARGRALLAALERGRM